MRERERQETEREREKERAPAGQRAEDRKEKIIFGTMKGIQDSQWGPKGPFTGLKG